jgi:hypothetical protein
MSFISDFLSQLPEDLRQKFLGLKTPFALQEYLDEMAYVAEERDRSPLNIMLDHQCHCLDGGLLAALSLWQMGFQPQLLVMLPEPGQDDDHVLALYRVDGYWGAVAKSNYVNLGFRDAVYKSLRELVMTYFEYYCSVTQIKTLRGYSRPLDASRYIHLNWAVDEAGANTFYYKHLYGRKPIPVVTPQMVARLNPVSDRAYKAETLYTDLNWSFGVRPNH